MTYDYSALLIDDEAGAEAFLPDAIEPKPAHPDDGDFARLSADGARTSDLVLVDHDLQRDVLLSMEAVDGASLIGIFRSWGRRERVPLPPIILVTNNEDAYAHEIPDVGPAVPLNGTFLGVEHRLAPTLDVEWVFHKPDPSTKARLSELAGAAKACRDHVGPDGVGLAEILALLDCPADVDWRGRVDEAVKRARPPVSRGRSHDGSNALRGPSVVVRWLLHRALAYPGLFLSDLFAAWTLRVTPESLIALMDGSSEAPWIADLRKSVYRGPLSGFFGRRWWSPGLDHASWRLDEVANARGDYQQALDELAGTGNLVALRIANPVVVWSDRLVETGLAPIDDAVQVHPRKWPAEALEPWMSLDEVRGDPALLSMVDPQDLPPSADEAP